MDEYSQNSVGCPTATKPPAKKKKVLPTIIAIAVIVIAAIVVINVVNERTSIAGTYYLYHTDSNGDEYVYPTAHIITLTEDGKFYDDGMVFKYKYRKGQLTISGTFWGTQIEFIETVNGDRLTYDGSNYVKLDKAPTETYYLNKDNK